ncbi:MAG: FtsX-like permease family protein [Pseudomonadota bacterium]
MKGIIEGLAVFFIGNAQAERMVPPTGFTVRLTIVAAAAMAFLATFALAFSIATGTLADRWSTDLARTSTVRISAPETQMAAQIAQVLEVLRTTPGVQSARVIELQEQQALLAPWFGDDLALDQLPIPQLIELVETEEGFDPQNLQLRLTAEAPGAAFDDHGRWQRPLVGAANRLRLVGWIAVGLIGLTLAVIVTLAAQSALAANNQVIQVMRLIGARDDYIAQAFVRRFTLRAVLGALVGALVGMLALIFMPGAQDETGFLTGLRPTGTQWIWPLALPLLTGIIAFWATRRASRRTLRELP